MAKILSNWPDGPSRYPRQSPLEGWPRAMWRKHSGRKKDRKHAKGIGYSNRGQKKQGQGKAKQQ